MRSYLWARGYMAISSGNITDEMIQKYIEEQEGEIVDDGRFQIELKLITPRLQGEGCSVSTRFGAVYPPPKVRGLL